MAIVMTAADVAGTVTDFGIALATVDTKITASHAVLGTARYIAPEQPRAAVRYPRPTSTRSGRSATNC